MENYCDFPDVLKRSGKSAATLRRLMERDEFPRPTHKCGRRLYWLRTDVEKAIAKLNLPVPLAPPLADTAK